MKIAVLSLVLLVILVSVVILTMTFFYYVVPEINAQEDIEQIPNVKIMLTEEVGVANEPVELYFPQITKVEEGVVITQVVVSDAVEVVTEPVEISSTSPIDGFRIMERVDLANGELVAMRITLSNGEVIASTWAQSIAFNGVDDPDVVFNPFAGTIYSIRDQVLTTFLHSGRTRSGLKFFALDLEEYILGDLDRPPVRLNKGLEAVESLRGSILSLCQVEDNGVVKKFEIFNQDDPCLGETVEFEVVAAVLIQREKVEEFSSKVLGFLDWLKTTYPGAGFNFVQAEDGYLDITCVGQFYDQPRPKGDDTPSYLFNRLVLGLRLIEEP